MSEPRTTYRGNLQHLLADIMFLVISAVISGANDWKNIEVFGKAQLDWLRKFVPLKNGIPSHDTLGRIFAIINHEQFSNCFTEWIDEICSLTQGEVVAIDGKKIRGSYDKASKSPAIHMVSAFAANNGLCLGQISCEEKSNEITVIPKLLEILAIKGCTVTIDAMGCQTKIAEKIIEKKADYILAVKENQKELYEQINKLFEIKQAVSVDTNIDAGHGRVETRKCMVIDDLKFLDIEQGWKGLRSIIKVDSQSFIKADNKTQEETRFYISSLSANAASINLKIRNHWSVENKLHWMLDVNFEEDLSRRRKGNSAKNFNIIAKIALSLIEQEESKGNSKFSKRYKAALDVKFREKLLKI